MKNLIQFALFMALGFAAFASIMLAGFYIAPVASIVVFGIEFITFIISMDKFYKTNKK